ncbi:MAG: hypothetical protein RL212_1462 [Pseudomonadota bacterium]|jgi:hypothetical protein
MFGLKQWQSKALLLMLAVAAAISTLQGFSNALQFSQDFQWSPSVLFSEGINPYTYYLNGNEDKRVILSQAPNYSHLTYVGLLPFSYLSWDVAKLAWAISTLFCAIVSVRILSKHAGLSDAETLIILFLFLCSTPLRNTIGNGQHGVLVLLCFSALFLEKQGLGSIFIGFGFFKYSFAPPMLLYLFFSRGLKFAVLSLITCVSGWLLFSLYVVENPIETLMQPLKVSANAVGNGSADIMTISGFVFSNKESVVDRILVYLIPVGLSIAFAWFIAKIGGTTVFKFSLIGIACLVTFKHLGYDFVFLLPAFVYAFKNRNNILAKVAMFLVLFNWFGLKVITPLKIMPELLIGINFLSCMALAVTLVKISRRDPLSV